MAVPLEDLPDAPDTSPNPFAKASMDELVNKTPQELFNKYVPAEDVPQEVSPPSPAGVTSPPPAGDSSTPKPSLIEDMFNTWQEGYKVLYPSGGPIETLKGYGKGLASGATMGAFKPSAPKTEAERLGMVPGSFVGTVAPVTGVLKVAGAMTKGIQAFKTLSPLAQGAIDTLLGAALYKGGEGAVQQTDPMETIKQMPQEALAWLTMYGGAYGLGKVLQSNPKEMYQNWQTQREWKNNPERGVIPSDITVEQLKATGLSEGEIARQYPQFREQMFQARMTPEQEAATLHDVTTTTLSGPIKDMYEARVTQYAGEGRSMTDAIQAAFSDITNTTAGKMALPKVMIAYEQAIVPLEMPAAEVTPATETVTDVPRETLPAEPVPVADIPAEGASENFYRVDNAEGPLRDHFTFGGPNAEKTAQDVAAKLATAEGTPQQVYKVPAEEVTGKGAVSTGEWQPGAEVFKTEEKMSPENFQRVGEPVNPMTEDRVRTLNRLRGLETHPEQTQFIAESLKVTPDEVIAAVRNIDKNGMPATDLERELVNRAYSDQLNRHVAEPDLNALGVEYVGMQEWPGKGPFPLYTDKQTGSTFLVPEGQTIEGMLKQTREGFKTEETPVKTTWQSIGITNPLEIRKYESKGLTPEQVKVGEQIRKRPESKTSQDLLRFINKQGGMDVGNFQGEFKILLENNPRMKLLKRKGGKFGVDQMAEMARDEGLIADADPQTLIDALANREYKSPLRQEQEVTKAIEKQTANTIDPEWELAPGQKVIINGEAYTKTGETKAGEAILKDGETLKIPSGETIQVDKVGKRPKEAFLTPEEATQKPSKPSQGSLPMDTTSTGLEGKIPTAETPETPLERATREAQAEKVAKEEAKRQNPLFNQTGAIDLEPVKRLAERAGLFLDPKVKNRVKDDLNFINNYVNTPGYLASKHKEFKPVYEAAKGISRDRDQIISDLLQREQPYYDLSKESKGKVDKAMESGTLSGEVWTDEQLRGDWKLNPEEIVAYKALRDKYDHALDILQDFYVELGGDKKDIQNDIRSLKGYAPLSRFGEWAVTAKGMPLEIGPEGTVFKTFDNKLAAQAEANRMVKQYPNAQIMVDRIAKLPGAKLLEGLDPGTLQLLAKMADITPDIADPFITEAREFFKGRGFKKHFIERKKTPGYSEDWTRVHSDYTVGIANYISRLRGIRAAKEGMKALDPQKQPELYRYANDYVKYMESPGEEAAKLRNALFMYYLGANPKSAALNLTQPITTTMPYLGQYTPFVTGYLVKAVKQISQGITIKSGRPHFDYAALGEAGEALHKAEGKGITNEQLIYELMAKSRAEMLTKEKMRVARALTYMFSTAETFNRRITFLAAHDIGNKLVKEGKFPDTFNNVQEFAEKAVENTQFEYGRYNRPRIARGKVGATFFTFKTFTLQYLELLSKLAHANGESIRPGQFAKALGIMATLAGTAGLPFMSDIKQAYEAVTGESVETKARDFAKDVLGDPQFGEVLLHGITRFGPVDLSGAIGLGDIIPENDTISLLGPAGGIAQRFYKAKPYAARQDYGRAIETISPEAIRGPLAAHRIATEGQRNVRGELIFSGEGRWSKEVNVIAKALSFQPSDLSRANERERAQMMIGGKAEKKKQAWTDRIGKAVVLGDQDETRRIISEISAYNKDKRLSEVVLINKQDIQEAVRRYAKPEDLSGLKREHKQGRPEYQRLHELFK